MIKKYRCNLCQSDFLEEASGCALPAGKTVCPHCGSDRFEVVSENENLAGLFRGWMRPG